MLASGNLNQRALPATPRIVIASGYVPELEDGMMRFAGATLTNSGARLSHKICAGWQPVVVLAKAVTLDKDFAETGTPSARPPARIVTVINPGIGVCVHRAIGAEHKDIEARRQPC